MPAVRANGITLAYDAFGPADAPPLLMLMGLGCQRTLWAPEFCEGIAAAGLRVICPDNRDVGESSRFDHLGKPLLARAVAAAWLKVPYRPPYTLEDMGRDMLGLLDALGLRSAHVVGGSMGGMMAQAMALLAPGRVRSLNLWMTTMSHRPLPPPHPRVALPLLRPHPRDPARVLEHRVAKLRAISTGTHPFDEAFARRLIASSLQHEDDRGGFERQLAAVVSAPSRQKALARLQIPTLVMHGTHDPLIPFAHGQALARTIPGARFEPLPGAGHEYPAPLWPRLTALITTHALAAERRAAT